MKNWQLVAYFFAALSLGLSIVGWSILLVARRLLRERNAAFRLIAHIKLSLEDNDLKTVAYLARGADAEIQANHKENS